MPAPLPAAAARAPMVTGAAASPRSLASAAPVRSRAAALSSPVSSAIFRIDLTMPLPSVAAVPTDSRAVWPAAAASALPVLMSTGTPSASWVSACRSMSEPKNNGSPTAAAPIAPPTKGTGITACPAIAPVASAPMTGNCPATADGIWLIALPAADRSPSSL